MPLQAKKRFKLLLFICESNLEQVQVFSEQFKVFKRRRISKICRQPIPQSGGCNTKYLNIFLGIDNRLYINTYSPAYNGQLISFKRLCLKVHTDLKHKNYIGERRTSKILRESELCTKVLSLDVSIIRA